MTSYRLTLVLAGAFCTGVIAFATSMAPHAPVPLGQGMAMLIATYAIGLGLGRLVWRRGE